jgi:transcriptional regulator with XRE-family HTH domain
MSTAVPRAAGDYLRAWRQRRGWSQMVLALEADISQRHLSFVESGRSVPSRSMLLHLAERLDMPLRERNAMLLAAGYAPVYAERSLEDPEMDVARQAIDLVLKGHEPCPALAIDRHWNLLAANTAVFSLLTGVSNPSLLQPPINVLRLSLHPDGVAPRIANLPQWRAHLLDRLRRQIDATNDPVLAELLQELAAYPIVVPTSSAPGANPVSASATRPATAALIHTPAPAHDPSAANHNAVFVPLELLTDAGLLSFISTTTVFGTPRDITLSELALEAFFPANAQTAEILRKLAANPDTQTGPAP